MAHRNVGNKNYVILRIIDRYKDRHLKLVDWKFRENGIRLAV
jgi:hypothetical protein